MYYGFTKQQFDRFIERLKKEEGFSAKPYLDSKYRDDGKKQYTYGYGTPAPHKDATITEEVAEKWLIFYAKNAIRDYQLLAKRSPFFINEVRREALCDMLFNMGMPTASRFVRTISLITNDNPNDWHFVAAEAAASDWYNQVGKRAERICYELDTGEFLNE